MRCAGQRNPRGLGTFRVDNIHQKPHREMQMLFKTPRSKLRLEMGPFTIITNLPGRAIPDHRDHGYGPLARFDESVLVS